MECSQNHNLLAVKFCPSCGEKVVKKVDFCINGHQMKIGQKFCADCGGSVNSKLEFTEKITTKSLSPDITNRQNLATPSASQLPWPNDIPDQSQTQNDKIKNSRWAILGVSIFVLLLIIAFAGGNKPEPVKVTVEMTLVNTECWEMSWGYGDIPGGQVIISVDGVAQGFGNYPPIGASSPLGCKFTAYVEDVPSDGESFSVSMASGRRGTVFNSRSELESSGWTFEISLGSFD